MRIHGRPVVRVQSCGTGRECRDGSSRISAIRVRGRRDERSVRRDRVSTKILGMDYQRELEFARRIAVMAGENARRIRAGGIAAETKADASPVTVADRENERLLRESIEGEFPEDGILGEEGTAKAGTSGRRWILDPIDGTRDFVRGNRFWCVLIALEAAEETLAGVAHFPMLEETYWATKGSGSYRNGECSAPPQWCQSEPATSARTDCIWRRRTPTCRGS